MVEDRGSAGDILVGVMVGVFGLIGLILASRALDIEIYVFGLSLAVFALLFIFGLVRRHYDIVDAAAHSDDHQGA